MTRNGLLKEIGENENAPVKSCQTPGFLVRRIRIDLNVNKLAKVMREVGLGLGKCIHCLSGIANMPSVLACFQ